MDFTTWYWSEWAMIIARAENMSQDDDYMSRFKKDQMPLAKPVSEERKSKRQKILDAKRAKMNKNAAAK